MQTPQNAPVSAPPQFAGVCPDARLCVLLAALLGALVWKAGVVGLCLYLLLLAAVLAAPAPRRRMTAGSLKRSLLFALAWPLLKLALDAAALVWNGPEAPALVRDAVLAGQTRPLAEMALALVPAGLDAGLLFLRLLVIAFLGLALALALSPPALALAVSRLLRPLCGQKAWSLGLALSLMLRHIARIHQLAAQTRQAARARGLPCRGRAYFRLGLPHMFRVLARDAYSQALGLAARDLGRPEAWISRAPLPVGQAFAATGLAAVLLAASLI